ncbi:single-stranded DNA-binding protein [Microbacterium sp. QXD-8]|uniref:Single-stranded DNA-binding protein n=1 Tax=Microbacterium psychrotolerans TaxID=3068321 RepID=A0ABU0YZ55_9MICO|nr:single-stranded DNA-binding protein [Microbacterium sp. QXD-8]MDQ7877618.1 single-stranded DNA-binding protein [Microbacterium sp. QXD-8]
MSDRGDTITITGNVATPPELKRTPGGVVITTFRVARSLRRYNRETGAWADAGTNFYTVSAYRTLAEHAHHSLRKGDRVILTGHLRVREWDNGTRKGTAVEIDADAIGHDLRWGTTTFLKDSQDATMDAARVLPQGAEEDAWAAPGVESAPAGSDGPDAPPVLVGAVSAASSAVDGDETPF